jgi:inhibitor of KinA
MNSINPLGDAAALVCLVDEQAAFAFAEAVRAQPQPWLIDVVQAYMSVAVYFDLGRIDYRRVSWYLSELDTSSTATVAGRSHIIPCCYEFALDLDHVAARTGLSSDEAINLHLAKEYRVYAIGFCPGFPYLGYLPAALCGVPRLSSPRYEVAAGSVGLTGKQTGIYTEVRPGGWNIIGRTPLELVNVADGYFPLRTGDRVQFRRIDSAEFQRLTGERLPLEDQRVCASS